MQPLASADSHMAAPAGALLGIGALSKASGIPIDTLRTWERRYGFPAPARTPGNQRLYPPDTIERLLLVARALQLGHRANRVVAAPPQQLRQLPGVVTAAPSAASGAPTSIAVERAGPEVPVPQERLQEGQQDWLQDWLGCVVPLDAGGLDQALRRSWGQLGSLRFLTERAGPFLDAVGEGWAAGTLSVAHEHFASERLRDFLVGLWTPLAADNRGPTVLCATLPGDQHVLGLHMVAAVVALAGLRVVFLGADLPVADIAGAARATARAVLVSVSSATPPAAAEAELQSLRALLPAAVALLCGGEGAPERPSGARRLADLNALSAWAQAASTSPTWPDC